MTRHPRLTPADMNRIAELCQQGEIAPNITEQLGVPYTLSREMNPRRMRNLAKLLAGLGA